MTTIYKVWLMRGGKTVHGYPRIYESLSGFTQVQRHARDLNTSIERYGKHLTDTAPYTVKLQKLQGEWSDDLV